MRTFGAFIDWCLRNLLRLAVIGAIAFVLFGFALQTCEQGPEELPRKVEDMAYKVTTYSRIYYTDDSYEWDGDTLTLHGFWVKEGGKWVEYKKDLQLNRRAYGKVEVSRK